MIFVTLGSQKFQFDRLLTVMDQIAKSGTEHEIFAQTGASTYVPAHFAHKAFLDADEYAAAMQRADIVITHGGTGAIIGAVKRGKKVIAVPRLAQYGEHVDDHQLQIIRSFDELGLILPCEDSALLPQKLQEIEHMTFRAYQSNTQTIVNSIDAYIMEQMAEDVR